MRIVEGLDRLCDELDLCPKRVKALVRAGAPIKVIEAREGRRSGVRYIANMEALEAWFAEGAKPPAVAGIGGAA